MTPNGRPENPLVRATLTQQKPTTGSILSDQKAHLSSLERGALIAEIVGAVAVVVSIIYLGYQVGENTNAVRVQTSHALLELQFQHAEWSQNLEHVELVLRGTSEPSSLSPAEWKKYGADKTVTFNLWEQAHYGYRHSDLDEEQWASWDRSFASSLCTPGVLLFWQEGQHGWGKPFQSHVNKLVADC